MNNTDLDQTSALLTDLYQLTMLEAYYQADMHDTAVYEFFIRKLPPDRSFFVVAGLEQVLAYLEQLHFTEQEIQWLRDSDRFSESFLTWLADLRFKGDVEAIPEGTPCFPNEPLLRITAPLPVAQLIEPIVINLLHFQTLIASKAVRFRLAAEDKVLVDFGLRRAHGRDAGLLAARASWLAGFDGTATVQAEPAFGIPLYGTMAHAYIEAYGDEIAAFEHFARVHPRNAVLLIDTYDTRTAAERVATLAKRLQSDGISIKAVRIDSGDLDQLSRDVRRILDAGNCQSIRILASGGLDEFKLAELVQAGAPIDGYGVGTQLDCSADHPYLDSAYKLQEYAGQARRKRSEGKATWPGRQQVWRHLDNAGFYDHDTLALAAESYAGLPLLQTVMKQGQRVAAAESLVTIRDRLTDQLTYLPDHLKALRGNGAYEVNVSPALRELADKLDRTSH
mgnify:CR=1 FL=1